MSWNIEQARSYDDDDDDDDDKTFKVEDNRNNNKQQRGLGNFDFSGKTQERKTSNK